MTATLLYTSNLT